MAFCPQCGAEATGNFCPRCGASIGAAAPGGYATPPGSGYVPPSPAATPLEAPGMSTNTASALCYLVGLVTGIIFLVIAPYNQNKTVRFHAFQSIFLHVGTVIVFIGLGILGTLFGIITHGLSVFVSLFLWPLVGLGVFILWLYMMWSAYNNKMVVLPVIGPLAQKQA